MILAAFILATAMGSATPASEHAAPLQPARESAAIAGMRSRLEALSPADPNAYYLLGEELADVTGDPDARRLAEQLFALAAELDRQRDPRSPLAAQACLALAQVRAGDRDRKWLIALARTIDPRQAPPAWLAIEAPPTPESEAYRLASAIGLVRSGEGVRARQLLDKPEVAAALRRSERILVRYGYSGGAGQIRRDADRWPCPECGNHRVTKRGGGARAEPRLCLNCQGLPGPRLSNFELLAQLRFEAWLLQGAQRSWSSQITSDSGEPLIDPEPESLAAAFHVDAARPVWRNGAWVAVEGAAQSDPAAAPEAGPGSQPPK